MKMNKKNIWAIAAILVVVCLVVSGLYVYFEFYAKELEVEEVPEKEIDDRISPLTTQAVSFEINRIRRKGIIDHMMNSGYGLGVVDKLSKVLSKLPNKFWARIRGGGLPPVELEDYIRQALDGFRPGFGWREKPVFSYGISFGDYEFDAGRIFRTWDTDYINMEFFRRVDEEQSDVEIEFKFLDVEEKFKNIPRLKRVIKREVEGFSVVYDFRTGRWSGDDSFNDSDGYGHYNGSDFEMWFRIRQTDFDGDGIPYWTEVNVLGTDPRVDDSELDPDDDGVPTVWEWFWGYDPNVWDNHTFLDPDADGLQNVEEYFMRKWLANPYHPEIYIETEFTEKAPFKLELVKEKRKILKFIPKIRIRRVYDDMEHVFWEESQQMLMERFNEHNITVHIDDGCMGGGGEFLPFFPGGYGQADGIGSQFYKNNFADERKGIFRYVVIGYVGGWCHPQDFRHYYDYIHIPHNRKAFKGMCYSVSERAMRMAQSVRVLHELGHSCGIMPDNRTPGCDNVTAEAATVWKDYKSAMSYYYLGQRLFDYSDGTHGENDFDDWSNLDLAFFQKPSKVMEGIGS